MADEDQAHAALGHEAVEDAQHVDLDGDVERGGGLVGDQKLGLGDQHHGDHRALAHAARQLVRIGAKDAGGVADLHRLQHRHGALARLGARRVAVAAPGLDDLAPDGHHRVERELRVLHHHAHAPAAQPAPLARRDGPQVDAVELQAPRAHPAGGEAEDRAPGLGLARAALADDAQALAPQIEGDAADDLDGALARGEGHAQVLDREARAPVRASVALQGRAQVAALGSSTSRRPSPRRLKPSETTKMAMPGMVATHQ